MIAAALYSQTSEGRSVLSSSPRQQALIMKGVGGHWSQRWCHHLALIIILSLLWKGSDSERIPGFSIYAPVDVSAQWGFCVHVPCSFTVPDNVKLSPNAKGLWYRGSVSGDNLVASKTGSGPNSEQRFILTGDVSKGDCSFSILHVKSYDESEYRFREDVIRLSYFDIRPNVRVRGVTDKPAISPINSLVAGKEVTMTCVGLGRCSQSQQNIKWCGPETLQNVSILRSNVSNDNGSTTYYSNLTFTPSRENRGSSISCVMTYVYSGNTIDASVTLDVQYPPNSPNITCASGCSVDERSVVRAREGSSLTLLCSVESLPPADLFWRRPDQSIVPTSQSGNLTLSEVSVRDEGTYTCTAGNTHGENSSSMTLEIIYNPKPDDDERWQCLFKESLVECTCVMQSVPFAAIKWVFDSKEYLDSRSSNEELTIMINQIKDLNNSGQKCRSSIISSYLDLYRTEETVCRKTNTTLIVVIVIGNIVILSLIGVGLLCYIKRTRKNTPNGEGSNNLEMMAKGTESDYQVLKYQTDDIYNDLKK